MRTLAWALMLVASLAGTAARAPSIRVVDVSTSEQLMGVLNTPLVDTTIRLAPGSYDLTIDPAADTLGIIVSGNHVRLQGTDADNTRILVHSALLSMRGCVDWTLDHLTIKVRNGDGTIVTSNSTVQITNCVVRAGIAGRKGSLLTIDNNEIIPIARGIELCDDAHAIVRNNLIEGPADSTSMTNLTAITIGCDSQAIVERNHLVGTQHGIAILDNANAVARFNIVERMTFRGISCESSVSQVQVVLEKNVVYECGAAGIVIDQHPRVKPNKTLGRVVQNIIVATGHRPQHNTPGAIARMAVPPGFVIHDNTCYDNAPSRWSTEPNAPREIFWRARRPWTRTYRNNDVGVDGRYKFHESAFLTRYGRWAN